VLSPGEAFVKIWRLQNVGTCSWTQEYTLTFFGGDRLGAPSTFPLTTVVPPGETADLAVDMIAASEEGTYQGFWRLANPEGELFGIGPNGGESFWVKIIVEISLVTPTPTLPPTTTPAVIASGILDLAPGSTADLDSGNLDPAQGGDLLFEVTAPGAELILPLSPALLESSGVLRMPSPEACLAATLGPGPVPLVGLEPGVSLCYQTGEGRPGLLIINLVNGTLGVSYTTWAP
jgi:hypothetical protein